MLTHHLFEGLKAAEVDSVSRRRRVVRNKWRKALTLVNNPIILLERLEKQIKHKQQRKAQSKAEFVAVRKLCNVGISCTSIGRVVVQSAVVLPPEPSSHSSTMYNVQSMHYTISKADPYAYCSRRESAVLY